MNYYPIISRVILSKICYWGLRNINDQNFVTVGQQKIHVQIEIGDKTLEPNTIEKCMINGNFSVTFQKHTLVSPFSMFDKL